LPRHFRKRELHLMLGKLFAERIGLARASD
jgi:hypothetical protein